MNNKTAMKTSIDRPKTIVIRIALVSIVTMTAFGIGDESAVAPSNDAKVVVDNVEPVVADQEPKADEGKEKPVADVAKPAKRDRAARARAAKPGALEAVAAPFRALFGGPAEVHVMNGPAVLDNVPDDVADNDPMLAQFLAQFKPILTSELLFVRLVCSDLTSEQRPKIKSAAEAGLKQVAKQMANQQNRAQRGIAMHSTQSDPGKVIRDSISEALKETLTEEQLTRYSDEANKRTADRKKASILSVVARLDGQLFMTNDQRDKIGNAIALKWQDGWEKWLMMASIYGDRYFPTIPEDCVAPHLNSEQKSIWNGLQKVDFGWWGGQNGQENDDDGWWGGEESNGRGALEVRIEEGRLKVGF